jgi:putative serine protease PepD
VAATAAVVLLGGGASRATTSAASTGAASAQSGSTGTRREVTSTALTATQIYQQDSPGVVSIKAVTSEGEDSGTGIVLNDKGLILTNDHVIKGATSLTVSPGSSSSKTARATVVGEEANQDLALIRVDPAGLGLKPLKFASSTSLQVGDAVYAIGNPYGLTETLTRGIVSALGREIEAPDGAKIRGAIQTDAALNPGNSGGPLLNGQGEVVGVNSQIASEVASVNGSQPGSTGVGFAIASNTVATAVRKIESGQGVTYASASGDGNEESSEAQSRTEGRSGTQSPRGEVEQQASEGSEEAGSRTGGGGGGPSEQPASGEYVAPSSGGGRVVIVP